MNTRLLLTFATCASTLALLTPSAPAQNRELQLQWLRNAGAQYVGPSTGNAFTGRVVSAAGDVNADGIDDFLVSGYDEGFLAAPGTVYLVYGGQHPLVADHLVSLPTADVVISGFSAGAETGHSLAAAGDVNDDGIDDFLIGVSRQDLNGTDSGSVYLIYGSASLPSTISLSGLAPGQATIFNGSTGGELAGTSVAGVGDVNDDGIDDVFIGAEGGFGAANLSGRGYVVFGSASLPSSFSLASLPSAAGVRINGINASDRVGKVGSRAGDVNGDGVADFALGGENCNPNGKNDGGQAFVIYGTSTLSGTIALSSLGSNGLTINGAVAGDRLATSLSGGGDVNGDGYDDIVVGADQVDVAATNAGAAYIVYGGPSLPNVIEVSSLGSAGVRLLGDTAEDDAGHTVAMGGDMNRDGYADVLVGAFNADPNAVTSSGAAYLVHGGPALPSNIALGALDELGVQWNGTSTNDRASDALAFLGDVYGDGFDAYAVGARFDDDTATDSGSTYVVRGACYCLQADGVAAEGVPHTMRIHGLPGTSFLLFVSPTAFGSALETGKGPFWVSSGVELLVFPFASNGELTFPLTLPTGLMGLQAYWQHIVTPQGKHCDLGQLLGYTIQ